MDFDGAIFDLDGTLFDSMDIWSNIDVIFLKRRNLSVPETYASDLCGLSFEEAAQYTINLFGFSESVQEIVAEWNDIAAHEYAHNVRLYPHVRQYLEKLKSLGVKLAVATALPERLYFPCLKNNDIFELFDAMCSSDEVMCGKNSPAIFELAARKIGVVPERCIVFDDVLPAIKSAKSAKMLTCGVYDKYSAHNRSEIETIADCYITDFKSAPLPDKF